MLCSSNIRHFLCKHDEQRLGIMTKDELGGRNAMGSREFLLNTDA